MQSIREAWHFPSDTHYLNHGSFGPPPLVIRKRRMEWIEALDDQPMDFFLRKLEPALLAARQRVAEFVGTAPGNLVFIENATTGMNIVAGSIELNAGDEVLQNNHEYGAVKRLWQEKCQRVGARYLEVELPTKINHADELIAPLCAALNDRTRVLIISHITSPTAIVIPLAELIQRARSFGADVCIDGPHAIAQLELNIDAMDCDFYTASCHKWLSAPFGSGFLYVHPRHHPSIRPLIRSWGRLAPAICETWDDEFTWQGTRDPSSYLSIPAAIEFLEDFGLSQFRERTRQLAMYAREQLLKISGVTAVVPADHDPPLSGSMCAVILPDGDWSDFQFELWKKKRD